MLITADGGGNNGSRTRLWKTELQRFADETGLEISVRHFPPGTSKWNEIEHRLFSFISQNWRGRPLMSYATLVDLIGATTTRTGHKVKCRWTAQATRRAAKSKTSSWRSLIRLVGVSWGKE